MQHTSHPSSVSYELSSSPCITPLQRCLLRRLLVRPPYSSSAAEAPCCAARTSASVRCAVRAAQCSMVQRRISAPPSQSGQTPVLYALPPQRRCNLRAAPHSCALQHSDSTAARTPALPTSKAPPAPAGLQKPPPCPPPPPPSPPPSSDGRVQGRGRARKVFPATTYGK